MPVGKIRDYLQTQGLHLPEEVVHIPYLAACTVMNAGHASIDRSVLWYGDGATALSHHIEANPQNEALLKQIFMALDSTFSREGKAQSATVYALMPSENNGLHLIRLAQQGKPLEQRLAADEHHGRLHLPVRTAQTGWLNLADDTAAWLAQGELEGAHHSRNGSQMSLPVCTDSGAVLGVVHVEYPEKNMPNEAAQAEWVALALALAQPLAALLNIDLSEHQDEQTE